MRVAILALAGVLISASAGASPLNCLTDNVYREARGEPDAGKLVVAHVAINRARRQPRRVCAAIARPGAFSWVQHRQTGRFEPQSLAESRRVARQALANPRRDPTNGATNYHDVSVNPYWVRSPQMQRVGRVGRFIVYRNMAEK